MELIISCIWASIVALLIGRAASQRRLLSMAQPSPAPPAATAESVLVVIPARDEAANIAACIGGLSRQTYPRSQFRVCIVDDHSTDGTSDIASALAAELGNFVVHASPPLPHGWVGKSHACWIGATQALCELPYWICFIDADVVAEPQLLASAVREAKSHDLDLLSLAPRQNLGTWAERLVMPCGLYCLAFSQSLQELQSQRHPDAIASGQFLLIRAESYLSVGGHKAVADAICEDVALARRIKQQGGRVALLDGRLLLSARMYQNWAGLRSGFAKNLVETFGGPRRTLGAATSALILAWAAIVIPCIDAIACDQSEAFACLALAIALIASASAFGFHLAGARFFAIPFWYGLLFPLGYTLGALIAADSLRCRFTRRVSWKGRVYR
ncbi:glycosyltransferase family 2 protein [Methylocystis sp. MJC1]|jgi:chlorobactene glucosyltransferase|uniref:glycosyltransferase n=1 Tax=Methylocystis sp. MJC1 TaxID=2654282 RepID=UPI0013E9F123|nr:glycosyltransferase family A protein [Methylocystis sp. MJC1]KAF2992453.1 4,4'-diaponeurosporenoate glycosyltransferase [Methylocystis sp. MJC1]MBU6526431.1 glycosyltransferase [Methylocystis sp. MJC1]UZX12873.1 glycosyltransferase family 2 protein [Methylocystis sp. MJC1]